MQVSDLFSCFVRRKKKTDERHLPPLSSHLPLTFHLNLQLFRDKMDRVQPAAGRNSNRLLRLLGSLGQQHQRHDSDGGVVSSHDLTILLSKRFAATSNVHGTFGVGDGTHRVQIGHPVGQRQQGRHGSDQFVLLQFRV